MSRIDWGSISLIVIFLVIPLVYYLKSFYKDKNQEESAKSTDILQQYLPFQLITGFLLVCVVAFAFSFFTKNSYDRLVLVSVSMLFAGLAFGIVYLEKKRKK